MTKWTQAGRAWRGMGVRITAALLLVASTTATVAAPAPWFKWRSTATGEVFCTQVPPGEGWVQLSGPYQDPRCERAGKPGDAPPAKQLPRR